MSAPEEDRLAWHDRSRDDVLAALSTSAEGLSTAEAAARRSRYGPNRLPEIRGRSALRVLADQVATPLMLALVVAGALAIALGQGEDGIVVLAVVALNAAIGFAQEYRAGRAVAALTRLVREPTRVRRDGAWVELSAEELVPGDVVEVAPGDRVGADLRVLDAQSLRAQEAALTGESEPVTKDADAVTADAPIAERRDVLHAGTLVAAGTGHGVAVATGSATELGRISQLLESVDPLTTPLTRSLDHFGAVVSVAIGVGAVGLAAIGVARGFDPADAALAGIGIAVAAVPEGLPAVVTIALAIAVQRMARRRAVVRRLPVVETLGSTTVIATDKTGTLTRNVMTVGAVAGADARPGPPEAGPPVVLRAGVLCNDAAAGVGDPTEVALLAAAVDGGLDVDGERRARPRLDTLPFDAGIRMMATLHAQPDGGTLLLVKGAPEAVLPRCAGDVGALAALAEACAAAGERVLVLAEREGVAPGTLPEAIVGLRPLGLQTMTDPLREGAADAVATCMAAGIRVRMITGDHPRTAGAIARTLGIDGGVLTGAELDRLDVDELGQRTDEIGVYARVAPEHKLRIVRALQASGDVVAMTGDGVNDAPALRRADVGVAMGRSGTAAAKESADIVLADDDISTLTAAVREGRRAYDNLIKALAFVLPTSLGQALIIAIAVLVFPTAGGQPLLPVEPVQILWINLIVAVALALPLALEAPEPGIMQRAPRDARQPLLDRRMVVRTVLVSLTLAGVAIGLFLVERRHQLAAGAAPAAALAAAQTTAVTGAVLLQALYLIGCRSLSPKADLGRWSNPAIYAGIAIVLLLQAGFIALPFMHAVFGSTSIDLRQIALAAAGAAVVGPVTWLEERSHRA